MIKTKLKLRKTVGLTLASVLLLQGCAFQRIHESGKRTDERLNEAAGYMEQMRSSSDMYSRRAPMRQMTNLWVDTTPVPMNNKSLGAKTTALDCPITFNPKSGVSITEFARIVTNLCGIPVNVTSDAIAALNGTLGSGGGGGGANNGATLGGAALSQNDPNAELPPPFISNNMTSPSMGNQASLFSNIDNSVISGVSWVDKPVSGLLDLVTLRLGLGWKYENNAVSIFYLDTKVMHLYAMPGTSKMETNVKSGSSSSGSSDGGFTSDGSEQSTELNFETNMIEDIIKVLESMITPGVGRLSVSGSTGTVAVTDRPQTLRAIEAYIDQENKRITRQVLLNVKVLSVSVNNQDAVGLDWNVVYQHLDRYGVLMGGGSELGGGMAGQGFNGSLGIINSNSRYDGTRAFIDALSSQGQVSTVASPSVVTMNLKPAPILVGQQTSYLAKVSTTQLSGGDSSNSTQELIPGTITTGFNMTLLPYLMKGPEMILQYSINLSDLTAMREISSGENRIQLPDLNNRIFSQSVKMRSGQTLILSGFDQSNTEKSTAGVGDPGFFLFGGKGSQRTKRDVIVVLITPIVSD